MTNNFLQVGQMIKCGACHPNDFEDCKKLEVKCICICHDKYKRLDYEHTEGYYADVLYEKAFDDGKKHALKNKIKGDDLRGMFDLKGMKSEDAEATLEVIASFISNAIDHKKEEKQKVNKSNKSIIK